MSPSEPNAEPDAAGGHYEVRVRGRLSPALRGYLCPSDTTATFASHTFVRLYFGSDLELPEIVGLFAANNAEVLDIRTCNRFAS